MNELKAVAYCRVSSKGQTDGTGLDRQEQTIEEYADKSGYEIITVYKEAFTGTESKRPVFESMIADLLDNGCRTVIVECLDRLARDLSVQLQIISLLASKGITLINAMTGQDVTKPTDAMAKAMINIQGVFAELDKSLLVRKLKKGREAVKAKTGSCEGRKGYGFRDNEKLTLERIKQLYRKPQNQKRLSCDKIAAALNNENLLTRSGVEWRGSTISKIIKRLAKSPLQSKSVAAKKTC